MPPNWFIGLPAAAGEWLEPLLASAPPGLRAFAPTDLHVTVAFLGPCGEAAARRAWACPSEGGPFEVTLAGMKALGDPRNPSALTVLLGEGHDPVAEAIGRWRGPMLRAAEARPERRPPLPHCTVARLGRRASERERRAALAWARDLPPIGARLSLDRLALFTWSEHRSAGQFRIVEARPLGAPR